MADTISVSLDIRINGQPIQTPAPIIYLTQPVEVKQSNQTLASGGGATALSTLGTDNGFMLMTDQALTLTFNGSSNLPLQAGAILLILNSNIAASAATNVVATNSSGSTANLKILEYGP